MSFSPAFANSEILELHNIYEVFMKSPLVWNSVVGLVVHIAHRNLLLECCVKFELGLRAHTSSSVLTDCSKGEETA